MKKNFKRKLSIVCKKTSKDDLDALQYLHFKNGFVYATNAHILVRQSLKSHDFSDNEIALLDGVCMHKDVFDVIYQYEEIYITKEGEKTYVEGTKGRVTAKYALKTCEKEGIAAINFEAVLPQGKLRLNPKVLFGVNVEYLALLKSVVLSEHQEGPIVQMFFQGDGSMATRAIVIRSSDFKLEDEMIIIMPVILKDYCMENDTDLVSEAILEPEES